MKCLLPFLVILVLNLSSASGKDINECLDHNGGCNQICTNTNGSYTCSCHLGYRQEGNNCTDIDECTEKRDAQCEQTCLNTIGSYTCLCRPGFKQVGHMCFDLNECLDHNGGCDQICTNTNGSYTCSCHLGYRQKGNNCTGDGKCRVNADCGNNQWCVEEKGERNCTCKPGYRFEPTKGTCDDIDECNSMKHICSQNCTNTPGSFKCSCHHGYIHKGTQCQDRSCGGDFHTVTGTLLSPNYPGQYYTDTGCRWTINVQPTQHVKLTFNDFHLEPANVEGVCQYDFVKISKLLFNGTRQVTNILCGSSLPSDIVLWNTSKVQVDFVSDDSDVAKGFSVSWDVIDFLCPKGWSLFRDSCFSLFSKEMSWVDARDSCDKKKGHLAIIPDEETNQFLYQTYLTDLRNYNVWIGLNDIVKENTFRWIDRLDIPSYTKWAVSQPNDGFWGQDCVTFWATSPGKWADEDCSTGYLYICQKPFGLRNTSSTTTTKSSLPPGSTPKTHTTTTDCDETFTKAQGTLTTPNYPHQYPGNSYCRWEINPPAGVNIVLKFDSLFDLEKEASCSYDFVQVIRGNHMMEKRCGKVPPHAMQSHGDKMVVIFKSDKSNSGKGFLVSWKPI